MYPPVQLLYANKNWKRKYTWERNSWDAWKVYVEFFEKLFNSLWKWLHCFTFPWAMSEFQLLYIFTNTWYRHSLMLAVLVGM
jgi:hypothetical protein